VSRNRVSYQYVRLHRLACRDDNSVPTLFLAPIDCSKIPAQYSYVYKDGGEGADFCVYMSMVCIVPAWGKYVFDIPESWNI
jgi:hypothetical protein